MIRAAPRQKMNGKQHKRLRYKQRESKMTGKSNSNLSRRAALEARRSRRGDARHAEHHPAARRRVAEDRRLRRLLQGFLRQAHLPGLHQGDRHCRRIGRRANRRGLARAVGPGGEGRRRSGRRVDDGAGPPSEGHDHRSLGAARSYQDAERRQREARVHQQILPHGRWNGAGPGSRRRRRDMVHHPGH